MKKSLILPLLLLSALLPAAEKSLPADLLKTESTSFASRSPDILKIEKNEKGLLFRICAKGPNPIIVDGPVFRSKIPFSEFLKRKNLVLKAEVKISGNLPDSGFKIRVMERNAGWMIAEKVLPDRYALFHSGKTAQQKDMIQSTVRGFLKSKTAEFQLIFYADSSAGPAEILFSKLELTEIPEYVHRFEIPEKDHIVYAEKITFPVRFYRPEQLTGGKISARDEENRILFEKQIPAGTAETQIEWKKRGFLRIRAEAEYSDGKKTETETTLCIAGPPLPEKDRIASRYGINRVWMDENWSVRNGFFTDTAGWDLRNISRDSKGKLFFSGTPRQYPRGKLMTFAAMFQPPRFLMKKEDRAKPGFYPPERIDELKEAVRLWAKNTPVLPDVTVVFNEPDAHWKGSTEDLVQYHKAVTEALKEARPEAKVGGPCMYSIRMPKFKELIRMGILENLDWLIIHNYVYSTAPEKEFYNSIVMLQEYLKETKYRDLPIAFTEFGWTGWPGDWQKPVSELEKARFLARSQILCTVRGIDALIYFAASYYKSESELDYSIIKADGTPLPAFASSAAFLKEFTRAKKGGTYLEIAPGVRCALFERDGETLAAFWSEEKTESAELPQQPQALRSMTGTQLSEFSPAAITPSPLYGVWKETALARASSCPPVPLIPGQSIPIAGADSWTVPPHFTREPKGLRADFGAPPGKYASFARIGDRWEIRHFEIRKRFDAKFRSVENTGKATVLKFAVKSEERVNLPTEMELRLDSGTKIIRKTVLTPGDGEIAIPLPGAKNGERIFGEFLLRSGKDSTRCPVDALPYEVPFFPAPVSFERIQGISVNAFSRPGEAEILPLSKAQTVLKMYAEPQGLHLQVTVADPVLRREAEWIAMWKQDCLQLAFDIDAAKPWEPNNVGSGLNGHRVVEYGIAFDPKNPACPQAFRYLAYTDNLLTGKAHVLMEKSRVLRDEKNGKTVYNLLFPWKLLGSNVPLVPGSGECTEIGFALLLNDANKDGKRHVIPFFRGILEKDATKYGRIRIVH